MAVFPTLTLFVTATLFGPLGPRQEPFAELAVAEGAGQLAFSRQGELLSAGYNSRTNKQTLWFWHVRDKRLIRRVTTDFPRIITALDYSPNGKSIVAAD